MKNKEVKIVIRFLKKQKILVLLSPTYNIVYT